MKKCLKNKQLSLGIFLLFFCSWCFATQTLEEEAVISALSLNIIRFTTWPDEVAGKMQHTIKLCVIGDNVVQQAFAGLENKPVGDKSLTTINLTRIRNLEQCHVLFISGLSNNILLQLLTDIKTKPVLTIGEGAEFATQGGMIGLENQDEKIAMFVNLSVVGNAKLNLSARLLKLAKITGN